MIKFKKYFIFILVLAIMITPILTRAQIVPCDGSIFFPCDFAALMKLVNNLINFALFKLALPIAAIMFAYAGIKLLLSGGSEEARSSAKRIFANTALGIIIAGAAFLIVNSILSILGYKGGWIGFD
jgi:hypothetical protein